jgi:hypothetical protein
MTSKERVAAAFNGKPADKVPVHHISFSSEVGSHLLGREAYVGGGIQQWREAVALWNGPDAHAEYVERCFQDAVALALTCENDVIRTSYWRYSVRPTRRLDEHTFLYEYGDESQWRVLRFDPPSEQCAIMPYRPQAKLTFDDIARDLEAAEKTIGDYQVTERSCAPELRAQQWLGGQYVIRVGAGGVGIPLRDTDVWLEAMIAQPDLVARHLDLQVEHARRHVEFLAARGFRYFWGGSDFASNEGPFFSPQLFRDLLLPRVKQIADICHQHGGRYLFASDGNLWPVADGLFGESGVDGYYEIDRRAGMDLRHLHDRFPNLTTVGNISSHTVHLGTREDVVREAEEAIAEGKRYGRTIVGLSNAFVPGTPAANVTALLETIRDQR